jgi:endogenous inhibitor of DNA gyrase (YacG/DUF329 family)
MDNFKKILQGLFSNKLLLVKQAGDRLKLIDFAQKQSIGSENSRYKLMRRSVNNSSGWGSYTNNIESIELNRVNSYMDYELMDTDAILSAALDVYADEATSLGPTGDLLSIITENPKLKKVLTNLFYDVLNLEYNLWYWVRSLAKNGDHFLVLNIKEDAGVIEMMPIHPSLMRRIEDDDDVYFAFQGSGTGYINFDKNRFELFEVAHFRLLSDSMFLPYGKSMIEGAKKEYKKLTLMEDAMLIHRIMRAPSKRMFKIDVGNINPDEVDNHMEEIMSQNKKVPYIDPVTGQYNLEYNIQNLNEDYYLPIRGDRSGTTIETLDGLGNDGSIEDIEYIRKKMMQNLKIPFAYLGEEDGAEGKCISPDTLIPLISGETKTVRELIVDYENGIKNYVYSLDTEINEIRPGEIEWAGFTRMNTQIVRVTLDNDKYIDCTPDHKFLLRNGEWVEAQDLNPDDSLMPLYLGLGGYKNHYTTVYHPGTGKYELVHRIVATEYNIKEKSDSVIHHIDFNSKNNNPENLDGSMNFWEHRKYHQEHLAEMKSIHPKMIEYYANTELRKQHCSAGGKIGGLKSGPKLAVWVRENGPANKKPDLFITCQLCGNQKKVHHCEAERKYCSKRCSDTDIQKNEKNGVKKSKYGNIDLNLVKDKAISCKNFRELYKLINVDGATFRRFLKFNNINAIDFIYENMPLAVSNKNFMNNYRSEEVEYKNHKVKTVIFLENYIDTCDLTIKKYHNFGTEAGVIIHNSLLAAEDVRFARTIERIQKVIVGELYKIAYVHLMSQGFNNAELLEFELKLHNPSLIYERQKIELLNEKVTLIGNLKETNLFSRRYIYENIFNLSPEEWKAMEQEVITDLKRGFREKQITEEGNDPEVTGKSFGTPHDLAAMYVDQNMKNAADKAAEETTIKQLYTPDDRLNNAGRPPDAKSFGTIKDKDNGRDPFGSKELYAAVESFNKNFAVKRSLITEVNEPLVESINMLTSESVDTMENLFNLTEMN